MSSTSRPIRVAVADDDADVRRLIADALAMASYEVAAAVDDGQKLVEACRATPPDLIVADVDMPYLRGPEAAAELNRDGRVPVVLVSGSPDHEFLDHPWPDYIVACLRKPFHLPDLLEAVARAAAETRPGPSPEDRAAIEQAVWVVMERLGLNEGDSSHRLRVLACERRELLADLARRLVTADQDFQRLQHI